MTKKVIFLVTVLSLLALSFSSVIPAFAAEPLRGGPAGRGGGASGGNGNQGSLGTGTGVPVQQNINLSGALDVYIHTYLADALGITPEALAARLDSGETFSQIALSLGFDPDTISTLLQDARSAAQASAVADNLITQEQADWLASRGNRTPAAGNSYGTGICDATCTYSGVPQMLLDGSGRTSSRGSGHGNGR
jgi:hypothetical protein